MTVSNEGRRDHGGASLVVLIDEQGDELGTCEKLEAHRRGLRHLAFSVILKDRSGRWLLQRRAAGKYHSPGLWTNSCCGHPLRGEPMHTAATRRVREELGIDCHLLPLRDFSYRRDVGQGLIENELVAVFVGSFEGALSPDPLEVSMTRWADPESLSAEMEQDPERFTIWFREYVRGFGPEIAAWTAPLPHEQD